jgi:hypothetical protein
MKCCCEENKNKQLRQPTSKVAETVTKHCIYLNIKMTQHMRQLPFTNKWASIILSILSRLQSMPATPLPWIKGSDNSYVEHEHKKESAIEGRNTPKEEEIVNYRVLKLRKTSDQRKGLPKEEIHYSASDLKVLNEDNKEVKDINESIGLSLLGTSDQGNSLAKDKENFSVSELEVTYGLSEEVDKEELTILNEDNKEVKDINESIGLSPLETSDQGNSLAKNKENFSVSELEVTYGLSEEVDKEELTNVTPNLGSIRKLNRIKNPASAKLDDILWSI